MGLSKVFVLCATLLFTIVKVHTAPVPGLLSGFFGGDDGPQQAAQTDINQLLRQYYTQQNGDQYSQYNPFGQPAAPLNYPQPQYQAYQAIDPMFQYQPNYPGYADPYSQYLPGYRGGPGLDQAAEGSIPAGRYSNGLDSFLPANSDAAAAYRLDNVADSQNQAAHAELNSPAASSLASQRLLAESASANNAAQAELNSPAASSLAAQRLLAESAPANNAAPADLNSSAASALEQRLFSDSAFANNAAQAEWNSPAAPSLATQRLLANNAFANNGAQAKWNSPAASSLATQRLLAENGFAINAAQAQLNSPAVSSLIGQRMLADNASANKAAASSNSANESKAEDQ